MSYSKKLIDYTLFDFIPHWNIDDKKMMASICFVVFNQYKTLEHEEKLSIALEIIWRRYKKINIALAPDNRLSGIIKKIISRTIVNRIRENNLLANSSLNQTSIYSDYSSDDEKLITVLSVEKILIKTLKEELNLLDEKVKCDLITCFEFTDTKNGALKQKELRKRKKIRTSCEILAI